MKIRYAAVYEEAYNFVARRGRAKGGVYVKRMMQRHRTKPLRERRLFLQYLLRAVETQSIFEFVHAEVRQRLATEVTRADRLAAAKLTGLQSRIAHHIWRPESSFVQAKHELMSQATNSAVQSG